MMKKFLKFLAKLIIILVIVGVIARIFFVMSGGDSDVVMKDTIAVVRLDGIILNTDSLVQRLKKLDKNPRIKGVIMEVNSPGGAVAPSQLLYRTIMKMKKPVYAVMETLAASGAYYASVAADRIYALESTTTGSIGVIMEYSNIKGLLDKIGIKSVVFKSGEMKDVPSATRDLTENEKQYLQSTITDFYGQFFRDVLKRRKIGEAELRKLADGRVFSGRQAVKLKLIDRIGTRDEAIVDMKDAIGNQNLDVKEYYDKQDSLFRRVFTGMAELKEEYLPEGGFYYLYKPGLL